MSGPALIPQVLVAQRKVGPSLASFTTFTRAINDEDVCPISPPWMALGMCLEFEIQANVGNVVTAVPTFQLQIKIGGVVAWQSDALATKSTVSTALPAVFNVKLRLDSIGKTNAAKVIGSGTFYGSAFNPTNGLLQAASMAVGTGFGSTADDGSASVDFGVVCSASNAANTWQTIFYRVLMSQY